MKRNHCCYLIYLHHYMKYSTALYEIMHVFDMETLWSKTAKAKT